MNYIFSMGTHNLDENYRGLVQSILDGAAGLLVEKSGSESTHLAKFDEPVNTSTVPNSGYILYLLGFGTLHEFHGYLSPTQMVEAIDREMAAANAESENLLRTIIDRATAIYFMPFAMSNQNMMMHWHYQTLRLSENRQSDGVDIEGLEAALSELGLDEDAMTQLWDVVFPEVGIDLGSTNSSRGLSFCHQFKQSFARNKNLYTSSGPLELANDGQDLRTSSLFALHHPLINIQSRDGWYLV